MMLQTIGGKIAPRPSLPSKRSTHPALGGGQRPLAQRQPAVPLAQLAEPDRRAEEAVPAQQARAALRARTAQRRPVARARFRNSSRDAQPRLELRHRLTGRHDRQRHDDRPRPGADRVQIDREPLRQQHDLGRHRRALVVGNLAQQRQVEAREAVDRVGAAVRQDRRPGPLHRLAVGVVAGELEGEVGLHAAADIDRAAGIHRPAAVGKLLVEDVLRRLARQLATGAGPERPATGCIRSRGSCRLRARPPSGRRPAAGREAIRGCARWRAPAARVTRDWRIWRVPPRAARLGARRRRTRAHAELVSYQGCLDEVLPC